jgi:hypothetical protein
VNEEVKRKKKSQNFKKMLKNFRSPSRMESIAGGAFADLRTWLWDSPLRSLAIIRRTEGQAPKNIAHEIAKLAVSLGIT